MIGPECRKKGGMDYRLGVARPFLMLKALFLILPLILPFKH